MKSLWRGLSTKGSWEIVQAKYLKNQPMIDWIRKGHYRGSWDPNIFFGLTVSFPNMGSWLEWKVGNGFQFRLRVDPYISGEGNFKRMIQLLP